MRWKVLKIEEGDKKISKIDEDLQVEFERTELGSGDHVLSLEKESKGWYFTGMYKVVSVKNKQASLKSFDDRPLDDRPLEYFKYSLPRIKNYTKPENAFSKRINPLTQLEFETIISGEIYYNRSVLGTVFNALPKEHQESFKYFIMEEKLNNDNLDKILYDLKEYLNFSVIQPARYLKDSVEILKKIIPEYKGSDIKIEFEDQGSLDKQYDVIKKNLDELETFVKKDSFIEKGDSAMLKKLEVSFKNEPLPIF